MSSKPSIIVVSAHAADFIWRAGGAIALYADRGYRVRVICLSYGERGESARLWKQPGMSVEKVKEVRKDEASRAAEILGADILFLDAGDYPLEPTTEVIDALVKEFRECQPELILTHALKDPYNFDHPMAAEITLKSRVYAQARGYPADGDIIGENTMSTSHDGGACRPSATRAESAPKVRSSPRHFNGSIHRW